MNIILQALSDWEKQVFTTRNRRNCRSARKTIHWPKFSFTKVISLKTFFSLLFYFTFSSFKIFHERAQETRLSSKLKNWAKKYILYVRNSQKVRWRSVVIVNLCEKDIAKALNGSDKVVNHSRKFYFYIFRAALRQLENLNDRFVFIEENHQFSFAISCVWWRKFKIRRENLIDEYTSRGSRNILHG